MLQDRNIQRLVRRQTAELKPALTAEDLFTSREYAEHVQALADTTTGRYNLPLQIFLKHENPDETAYTDGVRIYQDTRSHLAYGFESLENKYMANIGMILHECAHVLFCDFDGRAACLRHLEEGRFWGKEPEPKTQAERETLDRMKTAMAQKEYVPIFQSVYAQIWNCLIDPHDEDALMERFGTFVRRAIQILREGLRMQAASVEQVMEALRRDASMSKLNLMYTAILQFARFGAVVSDDPEHILQTELGQNLTAISKDIMLGQYTDQSLERAGCIHRIVLALWPWIEEELNRSSEQRKQNDPMQSDAPSSDAVQQVLQQLDRSAQHSGAAQIPQNRTTSRMARERESHAARSKNTAAQGNPISPAADSPSAARALDQLLTSISERTAAETVQRMISDQTCSEIAVADRKAIHEGIPVQVLPQTEISAEDRTRYCEMMRDLAGYSRRMKRRMAEVLRDRTAGGVAHHKLYGSRFEAEEVYRPDGRCFAQNIQPQDPPDLAISILADHSGSMDGERLQAAMRAAVLIQDVAVSLGLPVCVAGHGTEGKKVLYYTYTDFRQVNASEKYRLAKMCAQGRNRDGLAVEIAANLLMQRPESMKLLIVLSDGQPNHTEYGGEAAVQDIQEVVRRYRRRGMEILAAAIGGDQDRIAKIYGEGFVLNIEDLDRLPQTLAKLVRKRIMK